MKRTIWKFELPEAGERTVLTPPDAHVLSLAVQRGVPVVWVSVGLPDSLPITGTERLVFTVRTTGRVFAADPQEAYVGTFLLYDGEYVGHVYVGRAA